MPNLPDSQPAAPRHAFAAAPGGTRLDAWWATVLASSARRRAWSWAGPVAVTLLALALRLWNLGFPHTLIFDETYYVKDAWTLGSLGYEASWPDNPNPAFEAGDVDSFTTTGSFVVHPPLGKWLIWLGMATFGPDSSFGWRFSSAIAGTLTVLLVALIGARLFRSPVLGTLAGFLLAIDGLAITMSRTGLLDVFIGLFVTAAFGALLLDRRWRDLRLARSTAGDQSMSAGPMMLWWRPWWLAAALLLGAATAVKWSGLYFAVAFGLWSVIDDAFAGKRAGMRAWHVGALLRGFWNGVTMVVVLGATYLVSWTGWIVTSGGWGRDWASEHPATGLAGLLPDWLRSLWHYHEVAYRFHVGLDSPHDWASNPLTWPLMGKPTLFYRTQEVDGAIATITSLANPLLWWGGHLAVLALAWLLLRRMLGRASRERTRIESWRYGAILAGFAGGYLPWLMYLHRTVFFFYAVAWEPFVMLALTAMLARIAGARHDPRDRRASGLIVATGFVLIATAVSAFFWPLWVGQTIPYWYWAAHSWFPWSWR